MTEQEMKIFSWDSEISEDSPPPAETAGGYALIHDGDSWGIFYRHRESWQELAPADALTALIKPIYIVDREEDARTLTSAGLNALAVDADKIDTLTDVPPAHYLVALKNNAGALEALERQKRDAGKKLDYKTAPPVELWQGHETATGLFNALGNNPDALREAVNAYWTGLYIASVRTDKAEFLADMETARKRAFIDTGFADFNRILGGGFYPGFYVLGAPSNVGKSTLALQIADYIAGQGRDVLFFPLEQSRNALVCKSLSRMTATAGGGVQAHEIASKAYDSLTGEQKQTLAEQTDTYFAEIAPHLFIFDRSTERPTVGQIIADIEKHIKQTAGRLPVVFIDYLQIIAPALDSKGRELDERQTLKDACTRLTKLTGERGLTVIAISSFSRTEYGKADNVQLNAFKGSGDIEYSADCAVVMDSAIPAREVREKQLPAIRRRLEEDGTPPKEIENALSKYKLTNTDFENEINRRKKNGDPVPVWVRIIKQRNGATGKFPLTFTHKFNLFETPSGIDWDKLTSWDDVESLTAESLEAENPFKGADSLKQGDNGGELDLLAGR